MNVLAWWLVAGLVVLVLLIATNWFNDTVDAWLLVRVALTILLWPAPLMMWVMDR